MKFKFEPIDDGHSRAKVPGGWLVKAFLPVTHMASDMCDIREGYDWRVSMVFVPDPDHSWTPETE
jgi:hypothetical protein